MGILYRLLCVPSLLAWFRAEGLGFRWDPWQQVGWSCSGSQQASFFLV